MMVDPKELVRQGYLSPSYFHHKEIESKIQSLKITGLSNGKAVKYVANELGYSTQYVYRVLKKLL